jgi:hypothetical protein
MPIARDFFQTFSALPISTHPWVLQGAIYNYLERFRGIDPVRYLSSGIDIEEFHSEILDAVLAAQPKTVERFQLQHAYLQLVFIFACAVNVIQNGPVSATHLALAGRLTPEDTVVTFNWDTLMDRALAEVTPWRVDFGYSVRPRKIYCEGWREPADAPPTPAAPALLKLHGSTNWITGHETTKADGTPVLMQAAPPNSLYVFESGREVYPTYAGRFMPGYEPYSYGYYPPNLDDEGRAAEAGKVFVMARMKPPWVPESDGDDSGIISMPLMIPPVKQKTYDFFGDLFGVVWGRAQGALERADEIVIVGYSFPRTDHRSNRLFVESFRNRAAPPRITILDPSPTGIRDKFVLEFGVPPDRVRVYAEPLTPAFDTARLFS